jgi:hypothetical protein
MCSNLQFSTPPGRIVKNEATIKKTITNSALIRGYVSWSVQNMTFSSRIVIAVAGVLLFAASPGFAASPSTQPTTDDGSLYLLTPRQLSAGAHHTRHAELFSRGIDGINLSVLRGVDKAQSTAMDGGGYFVGVHARPAESPIGYPLVLFGHPLLDPPRKTSYCSGSSYTAFIEALDLLYPHGGSRLSPDRAEAMRMQEPDGGRREDWVKFWGIWNADGPGCQFALVQYSHMGVRVDPKDARPGDFMNINWVSGLGHSTVFLGWHVDSTGKKSVLYWASQKGTNGLGDQMSALSKIRSVKIIRLTHPENLFHFDPATKIDRHVEGDKIDW